MKEGVGRVRDPNASGARPSGRHGPFRLATHEAGKLTFEVGFRARALDIATFLRIGDKGICTISISVQYAGSLPDSKNEDDPLLIGAMDNPRDVQAVYGHVSRLIVPTSRGAQRAAVVFVSRIEKFTDGMPGLAMRLLGRLMCEISRLGIASDASHVLVHRGNAELGFASTRRHDDAKLRAVYTKSGFIDISGTHAMITTVGRLCKPPHPAKSTCALL